MNTETHAAFTPYRRAFAALFLVAAAAWWAQWIAVEWTGEVRLDFEEVYSGDLAQGLIDGLAAPLPVYEYHDNTGAEVYGLALYPLYKLFGSRAAFLRALAGLFAFAGAAFWVWAARRNWGDRAGAWLAAWLVAAPPTLLALQHRAWANHMESLAFSGALALAALGPARTPPSSRRLAAFGFLAGLATYFCLHGLIAGAALAVVLAVRWGRPTLRGMAVYSVPAWVIGAAPLWLRLLFWRSEAFWIFDAAFAARRVGHLFTHALPTLGGYPVSAWSALLFAAGCVAVIVAVATLAALYRERIAGAWESGAALDLFILLQMAAFPVALGLVRHPFTVTPGDPYTYRYLAPLVIPTMALVVRHSLRIPRVGFAIPALLIAAGLWSHPLRAAVVEDRFPTPRVGPFAHLVDRRGDDPIRPAMDAALYALGRVEFRSGFARDDARFPWDEVCAAIDRFNPAVRVYAARELGYRAGMDGALHARDHAACAGDRPAIWEGVGIKGAESGAFDDLSSSVFADPSGPGDATPARTWWIRLNAQTRPEERDAVLRLGLARAINTAMGRGEDWSDIDAEACRQAGALLAPLIPTDASRALAGAAGVAAGEAGRDCRWEDWNLDVPDGGAADDYNDARLPESARRLASQWRCVPADWPDRVAIESLWRSWTLRWVERDGLLCRGD